MLLAPKVYKIWFVNAVCLLHLHTIPMTRKAHTKSYKMSSFPFFSAPAYRLCYSLIYIASKPDIECFCFFLQVFRQTSILQHKSFCEICFHYSVWFVTENNKKEVCVPILILFVNNANS